MKNEIILYSPDEITEYIEVRVDEETVWLNRQQMALLFGRDVKTIGKHINNVFTEGELEKKVVVAKFATTTQHGAIKGKSQTIYVEFFNLDVIISVGYRVKSKQGTQFRIWATKILKDYILKGYALNQRMNRIENTVDDLSKKFNEIDFYVKSNQLPSQGVFFDGQIFDAYELSSKLIRSAKNSIILIDNYIDENTITQLTKKNNDVHVSLLCKNINDRLRLDVKKANEQYGNFELKQFDKSHDRFLIIDKKEVYHIGASLKDLGKKWFAFTKLNSRWIESVLENFSTF